MKSKFFLLGILVLTVLTTYSCKSKSDPMVNETSIVNVRLVGNEPTTVEGKYLLRFDKIDSSGVRYIILNEKDEPLLLTGWVVQAPEGIRILERQATVTKIEHKEIIKNKYYPTKMYELKSQIYEIKTTLRIAAIREKKAFQSPGAVVASFPAVMVVSRKLNAFHPYSVPEIRFQISYNPKQ